MGNRTLENGVRHEVTEGKIQVRRKREFNEGGTVYSGLCWRKVKVQLPGSARKQGQVRFGVLCPQRAYSIGGRII